MVYSFTRIKRISTLTGPNTSFKPSPGRSVRFKKTHNQNWCIRLKMNLKIKVNAKLHCTSLFWKPDKMSMEKDP